MFTWRLYHEREGFTKVSLTEFVGTRRRGSASPIEMCDLISRRRGTMKPTSASARRSVHRPAGISHSEGGRWRWSRTGCTVRNRARSYRRRGCHPIVLAKTAATAAAAAATAAVAASNTTSTGRKSASGGVSARLRLVRNLCPPVPETARARV